MIVRANADGGAYALAVDDDGWFRCFAGPYQYSRVLSGYEIPRKTTYGDPVLDSFVNDRLEYLNSNAGFRHIKLFWCLTFEPSESNPLDRKPKDAEADNTRRLAALRKTASILETQLGPIIGLRVLTKAEAFPFFS